MTAANLNHLLDQLPHGDAFRFVSEVQSITPGESGVGVWQLTGDEPFFAGHFPGNPIVPGVLIGEALAQFSGIVANSQSNAPPTGALLAQLDIRLKRPVAPPARITLESTLTRAVGPLTQFDVIARTDQGIAARGSLTLAQQQGDS